MPVAVWSFVMLLSYAVATALLKRSTGLRDKKLQRIAGFVGMYPFFVAMVFFAHRGVMEIFLAHASRTNDSSPSTDTFIHIYIASNIIAALGQLQTEEGALLAQLMAHHVLSIACFAGGFYFDRFRFWTAFAGLCETTNLFLVPVFAAKELPQIKFQSWYKFNGLLLWVTFVVYRLILFPVWLYVWYSDVKPLDVSPFEQYGYPSTIFALLVLSCFWFMQIHRGLVKQWTSAQKSE